MAPEIINQRIKPNDRSLFLDLPKSIRVQILKEARLVRKCPVGFSRERSRALSRNRHVVEIRKYRQLCRPDYHPTSFRDRDFNSPYNMECVHPAFPIALLRINRRIYEEAIECFYGENNFFVDCTDYKAIRILGNLNPRAIKSITSLYVSFSESSGLHGDRIIFDERIRDRALLERGWNNPSEIVTRLKGGWENSLLVYKNWDKLCHLFRRHRPSELSLTFRCCADDINTIRTLCQGFYMLPTLRELRVDFECRMDDRDGIYLDSAQKILCKLSTRLTGARKSSTNRFPFERLPLEVQVMILEECLDMTGRFPILQQPAMFIEGPILSSEYVKMGMPLLLGDLSRERWCCGYCKPHALDQCCCNHGTSWSSTCICFRPQTALFRVNKNIRNLSQHIFYSKIRFEIIGGPEPIQRLRRELSSLLRDVCVVAMDVWEISTLTSNAPWANLFREFVRSCDISKLQLEFCVRRLNYNEYGREAVEWSEGKDMMHMEAFHRLIRDLQREFGPPRIQNTLTDECGNVL